MAAVETICRNCGRCALGARRQPRTMSIGSPHSNRPARGCAGRSGSSSLGYGGKPNASSSFGARMRRTRAKRRSDRVSSPVRERWASVHHLRVNQAQPVRQVGAARRPRRRADARSTSPARLRPRRVPASGFAQPIERVRAAARLRRGTYWTRRPIAAFPSTICRAAAVLPRTRLRQTAASNPRSFRPLRSPGRVPLGNPLPVHPSPERGIACARGSTSRDARFYRGERTVVTRGTGAALRSRSRRPGPCGCPGRDRLASAVLSEHCL